MEKSSNENDKERLKVIEEELARFNKLVDGHRRILAAIGAL
jgi:hypothetical protein